MAQISNIGGALNALQQTVRAYQTIDRAIGTFNKAKDGDTKEDAHIQNLLDRQNLDEKIAAQKADREKTLLAAEAGDAERRRLSALRAASARQRASYGASGITGDTGSSEAVLLGLVNQSEQERAARDDITSIRRQMIDDNLSSLRSRNLLERSYVFAQ